MRRAVWTLCLYNDFVVDSGLLYPMRRSQLPISLVRFNLKVKTAHVHYALNFPLNTKFNSKISTRVTTLVTCRTTKVVEFSQKYTFIWVFCDDPPTLSPEFFLFALVFFSGQSWESRQQNGTHLGLGVFRDKYTFSSFIEETPCRHTVGFWLWQLALALFRTLHYHIFARNLLHYCYFS